MARKTGFTESWLFEKGLIEKEKGVFVPATSAPVRILPSKEVVIEKPIVQTSTFENKPCTEWFIKGYNVPSKKNSRQNFVKNGKQISIPSKNHHEYVVATKMQYTVFAAEFKRAVAYYQLSNPLRVEFTFLRSSFRRFDYCNACQTVEDLMVSNGWIEDDAAEFLLPSFGLYEHNKGMPGVKIKILL